MFRRRHEWESPSKMQEMAYTENCLFIQYSAVKRSKGQPDEEEVKLYPAAKREPALM